MTTDPITLVLMAIVAVVFYKFVTRSAKKAGESNLVNSFSANLTTRVDASTLMTKLDIAEQLNGIQDIDASIAQVDKLLGGAK